MIKSSSRNKTAFIAGAVGVPLVALLATLMTGSNASEAMVAPAGAPAQSEHRKHSNRTPLDPTDALAESKADLASCSARYQAVLDKTEPAYAKRILREKIISRCSSEHNLRQVQAIEARRNKAGALGQRHHSQSSDLVEMARQSREQIRTYDKEIEYLSRGELPDSGSTRSGRDNTAADRREALLEQEKTQKRYSLYTAEYSDCMSSRGVPVPSTFDYDIIYVKHGHERSRRELARVKKANIACRAKAESVAPGGPPQ